MIPGVLFAVGISANSFLTASTRVIYALFVRGNLFSAGAAPVAFRILRALVRQDPRLALGIALAGIGVGTAVVPGAYAYPARHETALPAGGAEPGDVPA